MNLRLLRHPAGAWAGPIGPETPVAPSQSLRSPLKVEATLVSTVGQGRTKMRSEAYQRQEVGEGES